jgi:tRNA (cytidine/uridine-2'-O-)-methyltransferase
MAAEIATKRRNIRQGNQPLRQAEPVASPPIPGMGIKEITRVAKHGIIPLMAVIQPVKRTSMRLALYQPDIPQNTGAMLRLAACFGLGVDVILPAGFLFDDKRMRRAGMDYIDQVEIVRHSAWTAYRESRRDARGRLVLLTTKGEHAYTDFAFQPEDTLLVGRESSGVPPEVAAAADARLAIPMRPGLRSLNVAMAAAIVAGEAMRQLNDRQARGQRAS